MPRITRHTLALVLLAGSLLAACGGAPTREETASSAAIKAGNTAVSMLGKPYRYGGNNPKGFDCSGLVYYSFSRAGMKVPRSTESQRKAALPVAANKLRMGDLLFFNQEGKRSSHVAIYVGDGSFVHAPSTGKRVRTDRLIDPYWKTHFVGARRFSGL
jgi:murein DD-endopeptidase